MNNLEIDDALVNSIANLAQEATIELLKPFEIKESKLTVPLLNTPEGVAPVPPSWLLNPVDKQDIGGIATVNSFCRLVNEMKEPVTRIYSSFSEGLFNAVIDDDGGTGQKAGRREHTITLNLERSESWQAWGSALGQKMSQPQLAEFLESRQFDILEPDSATLIETIERLEFTRDFTFNSKVDRTSGGIKFAYEDVVDQKQGTMKLPKVFQVAAVPYLGVMSISFEVNLRYRLEGSKLTFTLAVHNWETIEQDAFLACAQKIGELTGIDPIIQH